MAIRNENHHFTSIKNNNSNTKTAKLAMICTLTIILILTFSISVQAQPSSIEHKWTTVVGSPLNLGERQLMPVMGDINGNGEMEIVLAAGPNVMALDGKTGEVLWSVPNARSTAVELVDLDNDGTPEILSVTNNMMLMAINGDGTIRWVSERLKGNSMFTMFPIASIDLNGDGYPTIYVTTQDYDFKGSNPDDYTGVLIKMDHEGNVLKQTRIVKPCWGGISIADTNFDGNFTLFLSDRRDGFHGIPGEGLQAYDAETLELKWSRPDLQHSSPFAVLADVEKNGVLEVIATQITLSGPLVLNAEDGSTIRDYRNRGLPTHTAPAVYDIDGDGNLEVIYSTGYPSSAPKDFAVFDIVTGTLKFRPTLEVHAPWSPRVADVTGDGNMEIIVSLGEQTNYWDSYALLIYDKEFNLIDRVEVPNAGQLSPARFFDVDGDGFMDIVVGGANGRLSVFSTPAPTPNPAPRTWVQEYSEYRAGAAVYVEPPGPSAPLIRDEFPVHGSVNNSLNSSLSVWVRDYQELVVKELIFEINDGSGWQEIQVFDSVPNGVHEVDVSAYLDFSSQYSWRVTASDSDGNVAQETFQFETLEGETTKPIISNEAPLSGELEIPLDTPWLSFDLTTSGDSLMSYTVTTYPDVGSVNVSGVGNGTYFMPLSGLHEDTEYTWIVTANNGAQWSQKTMTFTTYRPLILDGTFDASSTSEELRFQDEKGWYESRNDYPLLITLDENDVGGNDGKKARFQANSSSNAYLSQEFREPQTGSFSVEWDIYVDEILNISQPDRTGLTFISDYTGQANGPSSSTIQWFVYLAFEKDGGGTDGTADLIAITRNNVRVVVAPDLNLNEWYNIRVDVDVPGGHYLIYVNDTFMANVTSRNAKNRLTHISFAQWNDGSGTFYVDNVREYVDQGELPEQTPPIISNEIPANGSTNLTDPELSAQIVDEQGDMFNVTFEVFNGVDWVVVGAYNHVFDGNYTANTSGFLTNTNSTEYPWRVTAVDMHGNSAVSEYIFSASELYVPPEEPQYPKLEASPGHIDFQNATIGNETVSENVTLKNTGNATLEITNTTLGGENSGDFTFEGLENNSIAVGDEAVIIVEFTPSEAGIRTAFLEIISNDPNNSTKIINLTGTGVEEEPAPDAWLQPGWGYRKEITIDSSLASEDLSSFPVLVSLSDSGLAGNARGDGADIFFTASDGVTLLDFEVESYSGGELVAWVRADLSGSDDTVLYMYYGNSGGSSLANPGGVWDLDYLGVYHLGGLGVSDSTHNSNTGTPINSPSVSSGMIGSGYVFDGVGDRVALPQLFSSQSEFTFEAWVNSGSKHGYIISQRDGSGSGAFLQYYPPEGNFQLYVGSTVLRVPASANEWHYVVGTFDGSTARLFVNAGSPAQGGASVNWPGLPTIMGDRSALGRAFEGSLDEIRVSSIARSQAYIEASYNNQLNPDAFISLGLEEQDPDFVPGDEPVNFAPVISGESPVNGSTNLTNPQLSVSITDPDGDLFDVSFELFNGTSWVLLESYFGVADGVYTAETDGFLTNNDSIAYPWRVTALDTQGGSASREYVFSVYIPSDDTGDEPENSAPIISGESPVNGSTNLTNPILSVNVVDPDGDLFNLTFELFDGANWVLLESYFGVVDGVYTAETDGFLTNNESVDYNWRATAIDSHGNSAFKEYVFSIASEEEPDENETGVAWFDSDWEYRKSITVDSSLVSGSLSGFPVLVSLSDSGLAANARGDGADIFFTASDGVTLLDFEVESYSGGELVAWVRADLSGSDDTVLYMYYGNSGGSSLANPGGVWDLDYLGVYHLGSLEDSSGSGNDGVAVGSPSLASGMIGSGYVFDGVGDRVELPQLFSSQNSFTVEAWVNTNSKHGYIISQRDVGSVGMFLQYYPPEGNFQMYVDSTILRVPASANEWHYVVGTFDGSTARLYVNAGSPAQGGASINWPAFSTIIGDREALGRAFEGTVDELRVSSVARSQSYIEASYNNQLNPDAFISLGSEEQLEP